MSTGEFIHTIPERFREERERLGFSRPELALALHVSVDTVKNWEGTKTSPNAVDLARFWEIGADVMFILTGQKWASSVAQDQTAYSETPAKQLSVKVAAMTISAEDADALLGIARRLNGRT